MNTYGIDLRAKPFDLNEEQERWVYEAAAAMTPEEKAGQLFVIMAKPGEERETAEAVGRYHVGGVLFRPVYTKKELADRFKELDGIARFPLLHVGDAEEGTSGMAGGCGMASDGFRFSTQMGVSASGQLKDVTHLAAVCAGEAKEAGINWTYSPIADIDMNFRNPITNIRTFGSDWGKVAECASEYVQVVQAAGVAACAKHFPGDGVDFRDQHLHPTCNTLSAEEWFRTYGKVYRKLIEKGVLSVMAGHILQPGLQRMVNPGLSDEELLPGSLSKELITVILRKGLGFNGVITTDSTTMKGYSMAMERERAIPTSIEAGCDMFCLSMNYKEDIGYLLKGIEKGILSERKLTEAVIRVLALKAKVALEKQSWEPERKTVQEPMLESERKSMQGMVQEPMLKPAQEPARECRPGQPAAPYTEWAAECAGRSVTLVKDRKGILPINPKKYRLIRLISLGEDRLPEGSLREIVKKELEQRGFSVELYDPAKDSVDGTGSLDRGILGLYLCNLGVRIGNTATHVYWTAERGLGLPLFPKELDYLFVSFGSPYHLADVPRIPAFLNAYAASEIIAKAVVEKITGESEFCGQSPVDPFCGLFDARL